jgi:hypothetical protein
MKAKVKSVRRSRGPAYVVELVVAVPANLVEASQTMADLSMFGDGVEVDVRLAAVATPEGDEIKGGFRVFDTRPDAQRGNLPPNEMTAHDGHTNAVMDEATAATAEAKPGLVITTPRVDTAAMEKEPLRTVNVYDEAGKQFTYRVTRRVARLAYPAAKFEDPKICGATDDRTEAVLLRCCAQKGHGTIGKTAGHNWATIKADA